MTALTCVTCSKIVRRREVAVFVVTTRLRPFSHKPEAPQLGRGVWHYACAPDDVRQYAAAMTR
jgi:hypothetical protein